MPMPLTKSDLPSPFYLDDNVAYEAWRARKLATAAASRWIRIEDPTDLGANERAALLADCADRNFALFRTAELADPETALTRLGQHLGLLELDQNLCSENSGLTAITVKPTATDHVYIPYTNRPLGWHTDGYYNDASSQVHGWLLYCVSPATEGGTSELLDHELAYIRLRDENPEWIRALMATDAFTIPANVEGGEAIRPDHTGPVFSVLPGSGHLHMRYSARQRNVIWKDDDRTREAAAFLLDLFKRGDEFTIRHRLAAGEGVVSNNILHRRDGFRDGDAGEHKRLVYRARYYQRLPEPEED